MIALMIPATTYRDMTLGVFGMGRSGLSVVSSLVAGGANVLAWDDDPARRALAEDHGARAAPFDASIMAGLDALVLSPGVPLTHPEPHAVVKLARAAGVAIIGDIEIFMRERAAAGRECTVIAITGTNGKSTTTALIGHLLRSAGRRVSVGGNIGVAVLGLEPFEDGRAYVLELSSYQIDLAPSLRPDVGILLNITPDHIDRHGSFAGYAAVKARLFAAMADNDLAVIGVDDDPSRAVAEEVARSVGVVLVSTVDVLDDGIVVRDSLLEVLTGGAVESSLSLAGIVSLKGAHNGQNAGVAYAAAKALGLSHEQIAAGMASFPGLAHRMEPVGHRGRVLFVNDSKATNPEAAERALASFERIYWIAGGRAKDGGLAGVEAVLSGVVKAYLIGEAAESFARQLAGKVETVLADTLERAVYLASRDAAADPAPEPVVLLSPACASFDQFADFEARGEAFRRHVAALDGITMTRGEAA